MFCWGDNRRGQAGGASGANVLTPIRVLDHAVTVLAAGPEHSCADASCWGRNSEGQLGDRSRVDRSVPALASELFERQEEFVDLERPWRWTLLTEGSWATRSAEDGFEARRAGTVPEVGLPCMAPEAAPRCGWLLSAASYGSTLCAQMCGRGGPDASQVQCSPGGKLSERSRVSDDSVEPHPQLGSLDQVSLGNQFACAIRRDQRLECWGDLSNLRGDRHHERSTWISGYWSAIALVTGESFGCFVRADERVLCFGTEPAMGLRHAGMSAKAEPQAVLLEVSEQDTPLRARIIAAGAHHACALSERVTCWGRNDQGQLGNGTLNGSPRAVLVQLPD